MTEQSFDNQATASVELVSGQVFAVGIDGARELAVGSAVYADEMLTPGGAGAVELRAASDGQLVRLGPGDAGRVGEELYARYAVEPLSNESMAAQLRFEAVSESSPDGSEVSELLGNLFDSLEAGPLAENVPLVDSAGGLPAEAAALADWLAAGADLLEMAQRFGLDDGSERAAPGLDALAGLQGLLAQGQDLAALNPAELASGFEPVLAALAGAQDVVLAGLNDTESGGDGRLFDAPVIQAGSDSELTMGEDSLAAGDLLSDVMEVSLDAVLSLEGDRDGDRVTVSAYDGLLNVDTRSFADVSADVYGQTLDVPMHHDFHWDS